MASYTYVNGVMQVTTEIRPNFKRYRSMNAQHSKFVIDDAYGPRYIVWQFISYATPIIQVVRDMDYDTYVVSCNGNPFGYSRSTSRQVTKWINDHYWPIDSATLRHAYDVCQPVTPDIATYHYDNMTIDFHSSATFHNIWR